MTLGLCACGGKDEKPVLTIERTEHASFTYSKEQPVIAELEERLGINIQLEAYPSADYNTKLKLQLGTNDLPDIVFSTYTTLCPRICSSTSRSTWTSCPITRPLWRNTGI